MATSPLFGWEEPDDTDLVKDGAAAMRTLGNAIDTSMGDLLGGTTGQVLSKASNANMDFTWVTENDADAIQNSIVNAKGDLIAASANDVPAILTVGANGTTLVVDSSTSTGLRYQDPVNANPVLNSAFQVWQRGTSFTGLAALTTTYAADRYNAYSGNSAIVWSRQVTNDTTNLPFIQYCMRVSRPAANATTTAVYLAQSIETINSIPYAGKTITFSFYARAGANYSATSSLLNIKVISGTGTDQSILGGFTGSSDLINQNATLTTTWQRFTYTGNVASTAKQLGFAFNFNPTGTAGAADYFEVTGVQLEVGSVATPFKTYAGTIQGETSACQRYYYRTTSGSSYGFFAQGFVNNGTTTTASVAMQLPVTMRVIPTAVDYSNTAVLDSSFAGSSCTLSIETNESTTNAVRLSAIGSGLTGNRPAFVRANNNTAAYVGFTSEL